MALHANRRGPFESKSEEQGDARSTVRVTSPPPIEARDDAFGALGRRCAELETRLIVQGKEDARRAGLLARVEALRSIVTRSARREPELGVRASTYLELLALQREVDAYLRP